MCKTKKMTFENLKPNDIIYFVGYFTNAIYEVTIKEISTDYRGMLISGVAQPISFFYSSHKGECNFTIPCQAISSDNYKNVFISHNKAKELMAVKKLASYNKIMRKLHGNV